MISVNAEIEDRRYFLTQSHYLQEFFRSLTLFKEDRILPLITEKISSFPPLTEDERHHINSGNTLIFIQDSKVLMIKKTKNGMLVAEVRKDIADGTADIIKSVTRAVVDTGESIANLVRKDEEDED